LRHCGRGGGDVNGGEILRTEDEFNDGPDSDDDRSNPEATGELKEVYHGGGGDVNGGEILRTEDEFNDGPDSDDDGSNPEATGELKGVYHVQQCSLLQIFALRCADGLCLLELNVSAFLYVHKKQLRLTKTKTKETQRQRGRQAYFL
jgi:hypothetical protein